VRIIDDHYCAICLDLVSSGTDPKTWGFEYGELWFHYRCIDDAHGHSKHLRAISPSFRNPLVAERASGPPEYLDHDQAQAEAMQDDSYAAWWYVLWPFYGAVRLFLKLRARLHK